MPEVDADRDVAGRMRSAAARGPTAPCALQSKQGHDDYCKRFWRCGKLPYLCCSFLRTATLCAIYSRVAGRLFPADPATLVKPVCIHAGLRIAVQSKARVSEISKRQFSDPASVLEKGPQSCQHGDAVSADPRAKTVPRQKPIIHSIDTFLVLQSPHLCLHRFTSRQWSGRCLVGRRAREAGCCPSRSRTTRSR